MKCRDPRHIVYSSSKYIVFANKMGLIEIHSGPVSTPVSTTGSIPGSTPGSMLVSTSFPPEVRPPFLLHFSYVLVNHGKAILQSLKRWWEFQVIPGRVLPHCQRLPATWEVFEMRKQQRELSTSCGSAGDIADTLPYLRLWSCSASETSLMTTMDTNGPNKLSEES